MCSNIYLLGSWLCLTLVIKQYFAYNFSNSLSNLYFIFAFRYDYVLDNSKVLIVPLVRCDEELPNKPIKEEIKDENVNDFDDDNVQTEWVFCY